MLECIYQKCFGGKWYSFLCCHIWKNYEALEHNNMIIEKNKCVNCGKEEILFLVNWKKQNIIQSMLDKISQIKKDILEEQGVNEPCYCDEDGKIAFQILNLLYDVLKAGQKEEFKMKNKTLENLFNACEDAISDFDVYGEVWQSDENNCYGKTTSIEKLRNALQKAEKEYNKK